MGDLDSSQEVTPQQEVGNESVKRSEMSIGLNCVMMALPENTVTGVTIVTKQPTLYLQEDRVGDKHHFICDTKCELHCIVSNSCITK